MSTQLKVGWIAGVRCESCGGPLAARGRTRIRPLGRECFRCEAARAEVAAIVKAEPAGHREEALATADERWAVLQRAKGRAE